MSKKYLRGKLKEGFQNVDYKPKGMVEVYSPLVTSYSRYWGKGDNSNSVKIENKNLVSNKMRKNLKNRNRRKLRNRKKIKTIVPRLIAPKTKLIRAKASNYVTYTCTSGALAGTALYANDFIDPFGTSGAGQPLGYDQWKTLYRTAYVLGCKVKFDCWNNQSTALMFGVSMMDKNQGTTLLTDYEYYKEIPKTNARMLSPDVDHGYIINKASTKKQLAVKNLLDNDGLRINLQAETGPSEKYYSHVWVQPVDQTTTLTSVQGVIDIEYIILLTNPIVPARSSI